jgi:PTS system glucitol/sorbitol-specific IIC component
LSALYFIVGIVVILIRGLVTEWITQLLIKRGGHEARFAEFDEAYAAGHIQGGHE